MASRLRFDQIQQFLLGQPGADFAAFKQIVCEVALGPMHVADFLLDRIWHGQPVDGDGALMADAVGAVACLVLDGGVPPGIKVNDKIDSCKIEACAARPQADDEHIALTRLKSGNAFLTLRSSRAAVEILKGDAARDERLAHSLQLARELTEHKRLVLVADKLIDQPEQSL